MSGLHGGLRDRWRAQVITARNINDATRVLLLLLADHMTGTGRVSVPRQQLASELGRSPAQVTARSNAAVDARWLDRVQSGQPGTTAVYQAIFGDPFAKKISNRPNHLARPTSMRGPLVPASEPQEGADKGPCVTAGSGSLRANQRASVGRVPASESPVVRPSERSEGEAVDLPGWTDERREDDAPVSSSAETTSETHSRSTTESARKSQPTKPAAVEHPEVVIARIIEKRRQSPGAA